MGRQIASGVLAVAALAATASGESVSLSFQNITNNGNEDLSGQLSVLVTSVTGDDTLADFVFTNGVGIRSSISTIYFDNGPTGTVLASGGIEDQIGTSFSWGSASPPDLPGGNSIDPRFDVTPGLLADAKGHPSKGIDTSADSLTIRMALRAGTGFADVLSAIQNSSLRIGMHIRSIGVAEGSDSYVSNPPPVVIPMPVGAGLASIGLLGVAAARRRR